MSKLRYRLRTLVIAITEASLLMGGLASSDCHTATLALWAAIISWPLWWWRQPAFLLVWTYVAMTGYVMLLSWLALTWMMAQHLLFGRIFC